MLVAAACEEKNLSVRDIVEKTLANAKENGVELCFRARCILGTAGLKHDQSAMAAISKIIKGIINGEGASLLEAGAISVMEVIGKSVDGEAILEVVLVGKTPLEALTQVLDDMAKNGGKTD